MRIAVGPSRLFALPIFLLPSATLLFRRAVPLAMRNRVAPDVLWKLAQDHSQQDPTFRTTLSYTRLTAAEALRQLRNQDFPEEVLPCPSTMADVLNRNGYRLRPVIKAKPQKKSRKQMPYSPTFGKKTDN